MTAGKTANSDRPRLKMVRRYGILNYGNKVEYKEDNVDSLHVSDN